MLPLKHTITGPALKISHKATQAHKQGMLVTELIEQKRKAYKHYKTLVRLFAIVGLFTSLLMVTSVFEWKSYDREHLQLGTAVDITSDEILDIPVTQQPPPPPQQLIQQPNIIEVKEEEIIEEIKVDFDIEITQEEVITNPEPVPVEMEEPEEEVAEEIFSIVEEQPHPVGGLKAFMTYISENIKYPMQARKLGIEGKVFVEFVINSDGTLTEAKVVKGIGGGCDEEALKVIENAPKWVPGKQRGKAVRVRMVMPIFFVIE